MKPHLRPLILFGFALAILGLPGTARAQSSVTCSSYDGGRHYCGKYNPNDLRLSRQLSESPCVLGTGWGVDQRGRWVDRGCRAEFTIRGR
jgi:hypothetical protein